ncbi:MAG: tetratricopeptide repeat protein [bacterium]|nr:tetratricopeptide repeat protein [bacterium]
MKKLNKNKVIIFILILIINSGILVVPRLSNSQPPPEYITLYNEGKYEKSLEIITKELNEIYSTRVEDKRVPTGFISSRNTESIVDLKKVFRDRKVKRFFIEENEKISTLHLYAARCTGKIKEYETSLNHYFQCLRFKTIEPGKDDTIFHEIAGIYKQSGHFQAYLNALETAYSLNTINYSYSLELGIALYRTPQKKKAIFHLKRYAKSSNDTNIDPKVYLYIGNLSEDLGRYLDTVTFYKKYLKEKPKDGYIHFALGFIAFKRTGDYPLAIDSFNKTLKLLPETKIFRRSKAYEYKGDMALKELEFKKSIKFYTGTIKYQDEIAAKLKKLNASISRLQKEINAQKSSLIHNPEYDDFERYEGSLDEKGGLEMDLKKKESDYKKLNTGKVRWSIAYAYERLGDFDRAIKFYTESIYHNYNPNQAREKIIKLRLKIK